MYGPWNRYVATLLLFVAASNNFLKVDIYYGEMKSEHTDQGKAYDVLTFFSMYEVVYS